MVGSDWMCIVGVFKFDCGAVGMIEFVAAAGRGRGAGCPAVVRV